MSDNTEHLLSLSYGKDSMACLFAIEKLGWPLDRIVTAEVWATDTIHSDLPPMLEFKEKADRIIKERWGIEVEHICAMRNGEKLTYEKLFYHVPERRKPAKQSPERERFREGSILGFPLLRVPWCNGGLKRAALRIPSHNRGVVQEAQIRKLSTDSRISRACGEADSARDSRSNDFSAKRRAQGADINTVQYLGIAADEPERIARHNKPGIKMPLVELGWDEAYCRKICEDNDLLSPIYTNATRGGCWFCHNQGVEALRTLRKDYPDLWAMLLRWDADSPVTFKPDGTTVHDYDKRFMMEESNLLPVGKRFLWKYVREYDENVEKGKANGDQDKIS